MANKFNLKIGTQLDSKGIEQLRGKLNEITNILEQYKTKTNSFNESMGKVLETTKNVTKALEESFNKDLGTVNLNKFNQSLKQTGTSLSQVQKTLTSCGSVGVSAWSDLNSKLLSSNVALKDTSNTMSKMDSIFKTAFTWNASTSIFNGMKNEIRECYDFILKLDESLNDIRIVTGKSAEEMAEFAVQANDVAKSLGATTLDYTNATLIYAQQGLEGAERDERARITTEVANLTKESTDIVSKQLTAVWNGYQISSENAEKAVDKMSAVAAATASDLGDLSEAMSRVAAVANVTGLDIDTLNASISTIVDVTQDSASKIGNSLKSIVSRIGDLAINPESADEFGVTLGDISLKLRQVGVDILDENNKLKDMTLIWNDIGAKWQTWSREQKQAVAIAVGGRQQYNVLMTLFDNWDRFEKARKVSVEAEGALQQQQDIYMESTKAHLNQLKTEIQDVYMTILEAKNINVVVDSIGKVVSLFSDFEKGLGGGLNSILNFGSSVSMLFSKQIAGSINTTIKKIEDMKATAANDKIAQQMGSAIMDSMESLRRASREGSPEEVANAKASLSALQKQKDMYLEMYEYRRYLTQEEKNSLLVGQKRVYEIEKEKTLLENQMNTYNSIEQKHTSMQGALVRIQEITRQIADINDRIEKGELTVREALGVEGQLRQQIVDVVKEQELLSKTSLNENLDMDFTSLNLKKAELEAERMIVDLYKQEGMSQKDVELLVEKINQGKLQELNSEQKILEAQQKDVIQEKEKLATTQKWVQGISMAISAMSVLSNSIGTMIDKTATVGDKINAWGSSITQLSGMVANFGLSTGNLLVAGIGGGISLLSSVLTPVISNWAKGETESLDELDERIRNFRQTTDETLTNISTLEELKEEYDNLSKGVNRFGDNINLTSDSYARYQEIVETVIGMSDDVVLGYDNEGKAIYESNGLIQQQIDLLKEKMEIERLSLYTPDSIESKSKGDYNNFKEALEKEKEAKAEMEKYTTKTDTNSAFVDNLREALNAQIQTIAEHEGLAAEEVLETKSQVYQDLYNKLNSGDSVVDIFEYAMKLTPQDIETMTKDFPEQSGKAFKQMFNKTSDAYKQALVDYKYNQGLASQAFADTDYIIGLFQNTYPETYEKLSKIGGDRAKEMIQAYAEGLEFSSKDNSYEDLARRVEAFSQDIVKLFDSPQTLEQIDNLQNFEGSCNDYYEKVSEIINKNKEKFQNEDGTWNKDTLKNLFGIDSFETDEVTGDIRNLGTDVSTELDNAIKQIEEEHGGDKGFTKELFEKVFSKGELEGNLTEIISRINWKPLQDGSETAEQALIKVKKAMDFRSEVDEASNSIASISEALDKLEEGKKLTKDDEKIFDGLEAKYQELVDIGDRYSAEYENMLRKIRKEEEETVNTDLIGELRQLQERLGSINPKIDTDAYFQTLNEIQNKRLEIDIAFNTKVDDSIDDAYGLMDAYQDVASVITKDFQISFEQAKYYASNGMGFILENAKTTGNGMLQLDAEKVQAYILNRQNELNVSKEQKVKELTDEKTVLLKKKEILSNKLTALQNASKAETNTEKAKYLVQANMYQADYEAYSEQVIAKTDAQEDGNVEISEDAKRLTTFLGTNSETQATNQMQAIDDADASYAQGVNNAISYYEQLCLKLQEVSRNVQNAAKGGTVTNNVKANVGKKGVNTSPTVAKENTESYEKTGNEDIIKGDYDGVADTMDKLNSDEINKVINDNIQDTQAAISEINNQIGSIDSAIALINSSSDSLGKNIKTNKANFDKYGTTAPTKSQLNPKKKKAKSGKGSGSKKGRGSKSANKKKNQIGDSDDKKGGGSKKKGAVKDSTDKEVELIREEIDKYHDLDIAIETVQNRYEDLKRAKDKLYGQSYINLLNKEENSLNKEIALERVKLNSIQANIKAQKSTLKKDYGISFDSKGNIKNYNQEIKKWETYFNNKIKKNPDNADRYKKQFETFKKNMENYETLLYKTKQDTIDAIEEAKDELYKLQLEEFTYKIELKLNTDEAKQEWLKFCLEMSDLNYENLVTDNIIQTTRNSINQAKTILGRDGSLKTLQDSIKKTMNNKNLSKADKQKYVEEYKEDLKDAYKNLKQLENEIREGYVNAIKEADEQFQGHIDKYDDLSSRLEHEKKVVEAVYGDESFGLLDDIYQAQHKTNLAEMNFLKRQVRYWESLRGKFKEGTREWEEWNEKLTDSTEKLNAAVEESIENLKESYSNAVDEVLDAFTRGLTGTSWMNIDAIGEEWDRINESSSRYLDTLEAVEGVQSFIDNIQQEIDNTDDLQMKQTLLEIQNEELARLNEKDKLSQYDLDRAEARYQVALKQKALEDSQNAKNNMRMIRDDKGNWTFNYTADNEEVTKAEEDLRDAKKSLYKLDKDKYNENLEDMYKMYSEWQEKIKELYLDSNLTAQELEEKKKEYADYYGQMINDICSDNEDIKKNLYQSTFSSLEMEYRNNGQLVESWLNKLTGKSYSSWEDIYNNSSEIMNKMNVGFSSTIQELINRISDNPDSFKSVISNVYDHLDNANKQYMNGIHQIQQTAEVDFSNVSEHLEEITDETMELEKGNKELIKTYEDMQRQLDILYQNFEGYREQWKSLENGAMSAIRKAEEYLQLLNKLDNGEQYLRGKNTGDGKNVDMVSVGKIKANPDSSSSVGKISVGKSETPKSTTKKSSSQGNGKIEKGDKVTLKTTPYYYTSAGAGGKGSSHKGDSLYITSINTGAKYPYHLSLGKTLGSGDLGWVKKSQISGFDTGGYTGDWGGNNGKLAILHKKELVLKEKDTANLLACIKSVDGISKFLSSNFLGKLQTDKIVNNQNSMNSDNRIHIEKLEVKANDANELIESLKNISLIARQQ